MNTSVSSTSKRDSGIKALKNYKEKLSTKYQELKQKNKARKERVEFTKIGLDESIISNIQQEDNPYSQSLNGSEFTVILNELDISAMSIEDDYVDLQCRNRSNAESNLMNSFAIQELAEQLEQSSGDEDEESKREGDKYSEEDDDDDEYSIDFEIVNKIQKEMSSMNDLDDNDRMETQINSCNEENIESEELNEKSSEPQDVGHIDSSGSNDNPFQNNSLTQSIDEKSSDKGLDNSNIEFQNANLKTKLKSKW